MEGSHPTFLKEKETLPFIDLEPPLPIQCFPVEDKTVSEMNIPGYITRLGDAAAEVSLEKQVANYSNLKILLVSKETIELSETYAKVILLDPSSSTPSNVRGRLEFTSLPEDVKDYLKSKRSTKV